MNFDFKSFRSRILRDAPHLSGHGVVTSHIAIEIVADRPTAANNIADILEKYEITEPDQHHFRVTKEDHSVMIHLHKHPGDEGFDEAEQAVTRALRALDLHLEETAHQKEWTDRATNKATTPDTRSL